MRGRTTELRLDEKSLNDLKQLNDESQPLPKVIELLMYNAIESDNYDDIPQQSNRTSVYINQRIYKNFQRKAKEQGFKTGLDYLRAILSYEVSHE